MIDLALGIAGLVACAVFMFFVGVFFIQKERAQAKRKTSSNQRNFEFPDRELTAVGRE